MTFKQYIIENIDQKRYIILWLNWKPDTQIYKCLVDNYKGANIQDIIKDYHWSYGHTDYTILDDNFCIFPTYDNNMTCDIIIGEGFPCFGNIKFYITQPHISKYIHENGIENLDTFLQKLQQHKKVATDNDAIFSGDFLDGLL